MCKSALHFGLRFIRASYSNNQLVYSGNCLKYFSFSLIALSVSRLNLILSMMRVKPEKSVRAPIRPKKIFEAGCPSTFFGLLLIMPQLCCVAYYRCIRTLHRIACSNELWLNTTLIYFTKVLFNNHCVGNLLCLLLKFVGL